MNCGKVYIVGAGPGDPGLITMRASECLRMAETVVYDRLIDDRILSFVPEGAERIYVGKSAKVHEKEQHEINRILIEKAREGKTIVRLKGGDPFVLGRGGEECEALAAEGIPFEVVPGVSSALAAPAYAGIPVTHRHVSSSFAVITGHEDPTKETSSIRWEKLATGEDTLIFLMGMGNLPEIARKLIENGRGPQTPVALIQRGTTLEQQVLTGTLGDIAEKAAKAGFGPPAVIVIGEVAGLRERLKWFENRPLFGKRVLVTRARTQASALSGMLRERGAQPVELPAIEIQPLPDPSALDRAIQDLPKFDWVIFTSANGVEAVWDRVRALGLDARHFGKTKLAAIGPATAEALEARGLFADFVPEPFTTRAILEGLKERGIAGRRVLLPRSDIAPKDLVEGLSRLGAEPHDVAAYLTRPAMESAAGAKQMLERREIDIIAFTSSSTVTNLVDAVGKDRLLSSRAKIACIGPITAAAAERTGLKVDIVAKKQTIPGLVAAIEEASNG